MEDDGGSTPLGQAGYAITGSGGGAGGQFVFTDPAALARMIAKLETLNDEIRSDGDKLKQAQWRIEPPGEDLMSRMEAKITVNSLDEAIKHNKAMRDYVDAQIAKMKVSQATYSDTDDEGAARLRSVDEG